MNDCRPCRGTGVIIAESNQTEYARPCPRCRPETGSGSIREALKKRVIPDRYREKDFRTYAPDPTQPSQIQALKRSIQFVESLPEADLGILFVGPCGVGKTHLAIAILKFLLDQSEFACNMAFVYESDLIRRIKHSFNDDSDVTERRIVNPILNADLIVWDDLGVATRTEWTWETIRMIINHRYVHNRLTIFTTNFPMEPPYPHSTIKCLPERVGIPIFSRLMEMCDVVQIKGTDYRRR